MDNPAIRKLGPDELSFSGRLQLEVARDALASTGLNPDMEEHLSTILGVHNDISDGVDQNDLYIYLQGGEITRAKSDIVTSLEAIGQYPNNQSPALEASRALLELLKQD